MKLDNIDKKYSSKLYRFFDLLYHLLVINILIIIISLPIVTCFPAIVAATATIKNDLEETNVFKAFFRNFKKYFFKSFVLGLIFLILFGAGIFGYIFWVFLYEAKNEIIVQIAVIIISVSLIVFTFMIVHIPLLIVTFTKFNRREIFRTSLYVAFRYFLTTMIMLIATILVVGVLVLLIVNIINRWFLSIWMIFGITLPLYLVIKVTTPIYYRLAKIDMNKIAEQVEEDLKNEK